jgi:hypothetical protein
MSRTTGLILTAALLTGAGATARAQQGLTDSQGQMTSEYARLMREAAPEYAALQAKLRGLEAQIRKITRSYANKEIDKDAAKEQLVPLLKEETELRNDPDYLAEQRLAQAVFNSPKFQEKVRALQNRTQH